MNINNVRYPSDKMSSSIIEPNVNKLSLLLILCFWTTLYITGLRDLIYGYIGWSALLSIWFISFIMSNTHLRRIGLIIISKHHSEIVMLLVWTLVILINILFDRGDAVTAYHHLAQTTVLWVAYLTAILYLYKSPVRFNMNVMVIIITLSVTCAIILPTLYSDPQIVRRIKYETDLTLQGFFIAGTTNFFSSYVIALPCLYVFTLQKNGIERIILVMLCLLLIVAAWLSTMTSAVLLIFMGLIGLTFFTLKSRKVVKLLLMIASTIVIGLFIYLGELEQLDFSINKIIHVYSTVQSEGIYNVERGNDALLSLAAIKEQPFLGVGPVTVGTFNLIGEHSSWLDNIAQYGFFGFAPFASFLFLGFRRLWRSYLLDKKNLMKRARIVCFMLYLIQGLFNPWAFDSTAIGLFITLAMAPEQ